jgi:hypothetical protein
MSINARVVLLVKGDTTLYKMVTSVSTKRWTITSYPKFDEPFGVRFHFENFWREPMSVDVIIVLLVGRLDSIHDGYNCTNEKIGSRITEN